LKASARGKKKKAKKGGIGKSPGLKKKSVAIFEGKKGGGNKTSIVAVDLMGSSFRFLGGGEVLQDVLRGGPKRVHSRNCPRLRGENRHLSNMHPGRSNKRLMGETIARATNSHRKTIGNAQKKKKMTILKDYRKRAYPRRYRKEQGWGQKEI